MGSDQEIWSYSGSPLYLHGWLSSCQWNEVFTTKHQPARIADIQFKRPKLHVAPQPANDTSPILATNSKQRQPFSQDQKMFFKGLKAIMPKSAILTQLQLLVSAPPPLTPAIKKLPDIIMNLHQPRCSTISKDELEIECDRIFREGLKSLVEGILKEKNSGRRGIPVLDWELEKEPCAHEEYRQEMKKTHVNFRIEQAGLFVNSLYPHI
ncbi:hypothetical protein EMCRGX_G033228 [Ephydatia muelleri]